MRSAANKLKSLSGRAFEGVHWAEEGVFGSALLHRTFGNPTGRSAEIRPNSLSPYIRDFPAISIIESLLLSVHFYIESERSASQGAERRMRLKQ